MWNKQRHKDKYCKISNMWNPGGKWGTHKAVHGMADNKLVDRRKISNIGLEFHNLSNIYTAYTVHFNLWHKSESLYLKFVFSAYKTW